MTFFSHHLLRNYAVAPLPLSHGAPELTSGKYRWWSATLEKLEVVEWHSGALRLTLTLSLIHI